MRDERNPETTPETTSDARELTDDELDSVAGGIGGLMGEAVKPFAPTKLDVAVQSDTFPRRKLDPSLGEL